MRQATRTYELLCQLCFVSIGLRSLDGQDDAIGNDGEEDGILEGGPFDEEFGQAADEVALAQDEEGGGALLLLLQCLLPPHLAGLTYLTKSLVRLIINPYSSTMNVVL